MLRIDEDIEEQGGASRIHVHVPIDLVHALAHADRRAEMHDRVGRDDERFERGAVANVALHVAHAGIGVRRPRAGPMHLRFQAIEDGHGIPQRTETVDEMRPDIPRATGDENRMYCHQRDTAT